jgi:hypothetical protein
VVLTGPFVTHSPALHVFAGEIDMLVDRHGDQSAVEDLILVVVHDNALCAIVLRCQEAVHPLRVIEAIVEHHRRIADLAEVVERIAVELPDHVDVQNLQERLVDGLDGNNDVLHGRNGIPLLEHAERCMGVSEAIGITPDMGALVAAVIEAVLGLGDAVEVNDNFQAGLACPIDCGIEVAVVPC